MKQTLLAAIPIALTLSAFATDRYGNPPDAGKRTIVGAAAGAALGAVAGAALGGDAVTGAGLGAIAGGAAGALVPGKVFEGRQYYKDTRGYCYYIGRDGRAKYDGTVKC